MENLPHDIRVFNSDVQAEKLRRQQVEPQKSVEQIDTEVRNDFLGRWIRLFQIEEPNTQDVQ